MVFEIRPADVYEDVRAVIGPQRPESNVCFCLSYRIGSKENMQLREPARSERVRGLCAERPAPGVLAYADGVPVGWAAIHPRSDTSFARNRKIPHIDNLDVWSLWCLRVRPGYRKRGVVHALIPGAVEFARSNGAVAVEAYPVDNRGERVDPTMAYVGTRTVFERSGFSWAADTDSIISGFPRVLMRIPLT